MKRIERVKCLKKIVVGSLVAVVMMTGLTITPSAAGKEVAYEKRTVSEQVPTKEGYLFAGWYKDSTGSEAVTTGTTGELYAKFVPAEVLSVKTQAKATVENATYESLSEPESLRVLAAVDSKNYQKVGFKIIYGANEVKTDNIEITTVYHQLKVLGEDSKTYEKTPKDVFGTSANYFFAVNINKISKKNAASQIYVCPYWVTLDGTTVYGQASNVFLEDHCKDKDYYRASVNLFGGQDVAAGKVVATYDSTKFDVVDVVNGRLFKGEIESNKDTAGTVTIVGNASTVNEHEKASDLLMTVRFTKKSEDTDSLKFTGFESDFCDWSENEVKDIVVQ